MLERTIVIGQLHETFPDWYMHREVQHISENRITFWTWWIQRVVFRPSPGKNEEKGTKQRRVNHRIVEHARRGAGRYKCAVQGLIVSWSLRNVPPVAANDSV